MWWGDCDCHCAADCNFAPNQNRLERCTPYSGGVFRLVGGFLVDCTPETAATEFRGVAIPADDNTVIAVTAAGDIWRSTNRGDQWVKTAIGSALNAVDFRDNSGVVVGNGSLIHFSDDQGESWSAATTVPASGDFHAVHFASAKTVFCCGAGGVIMRSNDGGKNWTQQTTGTSNTLRSIWFATSRRGFCVGDSGTVLATDDGGETWIARGPASGALGDARCVVSHKTSSSAAVILSFDSGRSYAWSLAKFSIERLVAGSTGTSNQVQRLWLSPTTTGGTFTLALSQHAANKTPALPFDVSNADLLAALESLPGAGALVSVSGGPLPTAAVDLEFSSAFLDLGFPRIDGSLLQGGTDAVVPVIVSRVTARQDIPVNGFSDGLDVRCVALDKCPEQHDINDEFDRHITCGGVSATTAGFVCQDSAMFPSPSGLFLTGNCFGNHPSPVFALAFGDEIDGYWVGQSSVGDLTGPNHHENRNGTPYSVSPFTVGEGQSISSVALTTVADDGCDVPALKFHLEWSQSSEPPSDTSALWGTWHLFEVPGGPHLTLEQGDKHTQLLLKLNHRVAALTRPAEASVSVQIGTYIKFTSTPGLLSGGVENRIYGPGTLTMTGAVRNSHVDPRSDEWTFQEPQGDGLGTYGDWSSAVQGGDGLWTAPPQNPRRPGSYTFGIAIAVVGAVVGDYSIDVVLDNVCLDWAKATTPEDCSRGITSYVWNGTGWDVPNSDCLSAFAECVTGYNGDILNLPPAPFVGELRLVPCSIP